MCGCGESREADEDNGAAESGATEQNKITGVAATDVTVTYDGNSHAIILTGTEPGDEIKYSADGENWTAACPGYIDTGSYTIYYKVIRSGFDELQGYATVKILPLGLLDGISATGGVIVYDGAPHCVTVTGALDGDIIEYSLDGENYSAAVAVTDVGEYTVRYRVKRTGGGYYNGECAITIIPDISGKYVNGDSGVIYATSTALTAKNITYKIEYGADGSGVAIAGDARINFLISGGILTFGDTKYEKTGEKSVFKISAGGKNKYIAAADNDILTIKFDAQNANIYVANNLLFGVQNANYCESVSGVNLERDVLSSDVSLALGSGGETTDVVIRLSERERISVAPPVSRVLFDGSAHKPTFDWAYDTVCKTDGGYTAVIPSYTAEGTYKYELVLSDDTHLPTKVEATLYILHDYSGVYCDGASVVEINVFTAKIDGNGGELVYGDAVTLGGKPLIATDSGIKLGDTAYERVSGRKYIKVYSGKQELIEADFLMLTVQATGGNLYIGDENGDVIFTETGVGAPAGVRFNGVRMDPVDDECYIIGTSELNFPGAFASLEIEWE